MNTALSKLEYSLGVKFQQGCRLCLSHELLEDVFVHKDLNLQISAHLSIEISENDTLSRLICLICRTRLQEFHEFQLRCLEVQDVLRSQQIPDTKEGFVVEAAAEMELSTEADAGTIVIPEKNLRAATSVAKDGNEIPHPTFRLVTDWAKNCSVCDKVFSNRKTLREHMKYHHQTSLEIPCPVCNVPFLKGWRMAAHMESHGNDNKIPGKGPNAQRDLLESPLILTDPTLIQTNHDKASNTAVAEYQVTDQPSAPKDRNRIPKPAFRLVTNWKKPTVKTKRSIPGELVVWTGYQNKHTGLQAYKCMYGCQNMSFHRCNAQNLHHKNVHHKLSYECDACKMSFQSNQSLYKHKQFAHTSKARACSICDTVFQNGKVLTEHMKHHVKNDTEIPCPVCNVPFHKGWRMTVHLKTHENSNKDPGKESNVKQDLLKSPLESAENQTDHDEASKADGLQAESFKPVVAGRDLQSTYLESEDCDSLQHDEMSSDLEHQQNSMPQLINCPVCGQQVQESDMEGHQNEHFDYRPYDCERGCNGVSFNCESSREDHYQLVHDAQHECDICHKMYRSKASLWYHKRNTHIEDGFKCIFCDEVFPTSLHAKEHMKKVHL